MSNYSENLQYIESLKSYKGGVNENIPLCIKALEDMKYIVEQCEIFQIKQPEIFPWAGGNGIQAEWRYDWYLEIDSCMNSVSILFVKGKDYKNAISTHIDNIKDAFLLAKEFISHIVVQIK